jgi:hypothetical protein
MDTDVSDAYTEMKRMIIKKTKEEGIENSICISFNKNVASRVSARLMNIYI